MKKRCLGVLCRVSPAYGILPKSYFPPGVTPSDTIPYATGVFADVWKGRQDGDQVCIKTFRTKKAADLDEIKRVRAVPYCDEEMSSTLLQSEVLQ